MSFLPPKNDEYDEILLEKQRLKRELDNKLIQIVRNCTADYEKIQLLEEFNTIIQLGSRIDQLNNSFPYRYSCTESSLKIWKSIQKK